MPKIVDKEVMRERILEAAMQTFRAQGFQAAKMADIAKAAGLAKGTVYLYFESKEALTTALVKWLFQDIERQIMPTDMAQTLDDYMAQIRWALDAPEESGIDTRMFFEVLGPSFGSAEVVGEIAAFFDRIGAINARQLKHLIKVGEVRQDVDADAMGRSMASLVDGMVMHRTLFGLADTQFRAMTNETLELIRRGLQP